MVTRGIYYGLLDTVLFGSDVSEQVRRERSAAATGVVMLNLLLRGATPVLSQTQAFDNAMLLDQIAQTTEDSRALLRLVGAGTVQVRILDSPMLLTPTEDQRFSVLNAFMSALALPTFRFSGWPQLNDPALRAEVLRVLQRDPSGVRRLRELGDERLVSRLEALRELDSHLRRSPVSERARPPRQRSDLSSLVIEGLRHLSDADDDWSEKGLTWLRDPLREADEESLKRLNSRGTWYRLAERLVTQSPDLAPAAVAARNLIDSAYNVVVAESLSADPFMATGTVDVADALVSVTDDPETGALAVELIKDDRRKDWLTWSYLEEINADLEHMSVDRRIEYLAREHSSFVGRIELDGRHGFLLRLTSPTNVATAAATGLGGMMGGVTAGPGGIVVGAFGSAIVRLFATPFTQSADRRRRDKQERKRAQQWLNAANASATVATGTASWRPWRRGTR